MSVPPGTLRRSAVCVAMALLGLLAAATSALGIAPPGGLGSTPGSPSQSTSWTFSWSAPEPDPDFTIIDYEGGIGGAEGSLGNDLSEPASLGEGVHTFQVRAVEQGPLLPPPTPDDPQEPAEVRRSGFRTITVRVDRTPPNISGGLSPGSPNGTNGWYRSVSVVFSCSDPGGSGIASCSGSGPVGTQGPNQRRLGTAVDNVGLSAQAFSPVFNFDGLGPRTGAPSVPAANGRLSVEPTYVFTSGGDATSGVARYEVQVSLNGGATFTTIARAGQPPSPVPSTLSATRDPSLRSTPLPERVAITWRIRTVDNAGNTTDSGRRTFTIDSTAPPAPAITGGPGGPTNDNTPTFAWQGNQPNYQWDVTAAGSETPSQTGAGPATGATLPPLPDGDYTFRVTQMSAFGAQSFEATRTFQVDTVAPSAPVITARPPFPTNTATPAFEWSADENIAAFRYQVIGSGGAMAQGPADLPQPKVVLKPLGPGAYSFRVNQIDAAGNVSAPTSDPFAIVGPSSSVGGSLTRKSLPARNARRLRPRAGALLKTRTPVLQWVRGPRGTTVYNLQLFRVVKRRAGRAPIVKKVYSGFPKGTQFRLPKAKVRAGTCYVWRVWPYLGTRFTSEPLGISNFCIASKKALAKAAQGRKQRRR